MAIRVVNLHKILRFVWDQDPGKGTEDETVFEYRPLSSYEQAYLNDRLMVMDSSVIAAAMQDDADDTVVAGPRAEVYKVAVEAARLATTGIINLQDEEGQALEFKQVKANVNGKTVLVMDEGLLKALPIGLLIQYYRTIMAANVVTAQEEKNSAPAS